MNSVVFDASAIIALLNQEVGADQLTPAIVSHAVGSTVNLAEVQSKFVHEGIPEDKAWQAALCSVQEGVPFTAQQAKTAGSLIALTRPLGLSLGDRACLALALERKATVYTADRSWKKLNIGVRIHVIR
ncbi:MAG: type II toxin-antitoxin system VapC family toxin [Candidatus Sulfotelmatobacter sp.]